MVYLCSCRCLDTVYHSLTADVKISVYSYIFSLSTLFSDSYSASPPLSLLGSPAYLIMTVIT